ncbi:hypothetical protein MTO96_031950 [Rhipicephalus appendiculatus]
MLFAKLIALFGIAAADFDYRGRPTYQDVLEFYRVGEIIYLLKRTYTVKINGEHPTCVYNKVMNRRSITFILQQGYTAGYKHISYDVEATTSLETNTDVAPILSAVKTKNNNISRNYRFHFYDPVAHCAVLTFMDYSGTIRVQPLSGATNLLAVWEGDLEVPLEAVPAWKRLDYSAELPLQRWHVVVPNNHQVTDVQLGRRRRLAVMGGAQEK